MRFNLPIGSSRGRSTGCYRTVLATFDIGSGIDVCSCIIARSATASASLFSTPQLWYFLAFDYYGGSRRVGVVAFSVGRRHLRFAVVPAVDAVGGGVVGVVIGAVDDDTVGRRIRHCQRRFVPGAQ